MGRESRCTVRHDGREAEARTQLETDELTVRTPFRLTIPRSQIASTDVRGDELEVAYDGGSVTLVLGEQEAARWAHDISHPRTLADKLGVKAGQRVRLVGDADPALVGAGERITDGEADVVFIGAESPDDLRLIGPLQDQIARDGSIWVIRPKGRADLTEAMVIAAGRDAKLHDVKIARVSDTHTAMKFVIPVERR